MDDEETTRYSNGGYMNERIRELLSQAGVHYEVMPKDTVYEKFAELIIKECAKVAHECIDDEWFDVGGAIKEHFGVK
jgi:hypothetical protein